MGTPNTQAKYERNEQHSQSLGEGKESIAEFTERLFTVYPPSEDLVSSGRSCQASRRPFLKAATLAKQFKWVWYELTGAPPSAPRGEALLFSRLERDARVSLPDDVVARSETVIADLVGPWKSRLDDLTATLRSRYGANPSEELTRLVVPRGFRHLPG